MRNILIFILLIISQVSLSQEIDGYYIGLERMCSINKKGKKVCYDSPRKWYHINHLYVDHDSLFLYQEPIILKNRDTLYSASDGAFYYYAGKILNEGENKSVTFVLTNCDYCAWQVNIDTLTNTYVSVPVIKNYQLTIQNDNLIINKVRYKLLNDREFPFDKKSYFFKIQDNKPKKLN